ncbi:MAG: hypothetical protein WCI18_06940 [Pseudomonadota bacterium]
MNPFRNRKFISCLAAITSSSIIAQTSERSEEGIKVYSGGFYALSASQKEGVRSISVTSGLELKTEFFKNERDVLEPQTFSLFGNLTQMWNRRPPQSRFGLRYSKELKWRRWGLTLNMEGSARQWREGEDGALFVDAGSAGPVERHQFDYKAQIGSRYRLTERSEVHLDLNAGRQLHYAQGDRFKLSTGFKHEASRTMSHEISLSSSYFLGKNPNLGMQQETIQELELMSSLKLDEVLQLRCRGGFGEIHATSRAGQSFYSGGCLADRRAPLFKESFEITRSVDKDFFSGDFIESDKLEMGLSRNLGLKDRASFYLAYVVDRDVGGPLPGNKRRLDTSVNLMSPWDGLKGRTDLKDPYVLTAATWSFEDTGSRRQGQVYQMGVGALL